MLALTDGATEAMNPAQASSSARERLRTSLGWLGDAGRTPVAIVDRVRDDVRRFSGDGGTGRRPDAAGGALERARRSAVSGR